MKHFVPAPENKALRRIIYVGIISFIIGFILVYAVLAWLIVHFIDKDTRWWNILHCAINAILISVFGGLCFALGSVWILDWFHYRCGVYRCQFCGRPLKSMRDFCDCPQAQSLKRDLGNL